MHKLLKFLSITLIGLSVATGVQANVRAEMNQMKTVAATLTNAKMSLNFKNLRKYCVKLRNNLVKKDHQVLQMMRILKVIKRG